MSERRESHEACLGGRVGSTYDFMVNVEIGKFESSILLCILMDGRGLKCFAKSLKFSKMTSMG